MKYGYARVSTIGQSYKTQVQKLRQAGVRPVNIYHEHFTGKTTHRPQFGKLMQLLKSGDQLIFTRLDRFARNTEEALHWIKQLLNRGVSIYIIEQIGHVDNTPTGKLIVTVMAAIADFERQIILDRTEEGREYARKYKHVKFGRKPRMNNSKKRNYYCRIYADYKRVGATKAAADYNVSRQSVYYISRAVKRYKDSLAPY